MYFNREPLAGPSKKEQAQQLNKATVPVVSSIGNL